MPEGESEAIAELEDKTNLVGITNKNLPPVWEVNFYLVFRKAIRDLNEVTLEENKQALMLVY